MSRYSHQSLEERIAFFREHTGFSYPASATRSQKAKARLSVATDLANAEIEAERLGLVCGWEPDDFANPETGEYDCACLVVWRADDVSWELDMFSVRKGAHCIAALGGIERNSSREFIRLQTAEVYRMALDEIDAEYQLAADELASRATYAAGNGARA